MNVTVTSLSHKKFREYGRVLIPKTTEKPDNTGINLFNFYVVFSNNSEGWRIGFLEVSANQTYRLEQHLHTPEAFIPLKGDSVLFVSNETVPSQAINAFPLQEPVVLKEGMQHDVISLSEKSELLIVENPKVKDNYHTLTDRPLSVKR